MTFVIIASYPIKKKKIVFALDPSGDCASDRPLLRESARGDARMIRGPASLGLEIGLTPMTSHRSMTSPRATLRQAFAYSHFGLGFVCL